MKNSQLKLTLRSLIYYGKDYVNQAIIIALLAAIITGSLLTGDSVRSSLRKSSAEKLGNTYILASSGLRYFNPSVADRILSLHHVYTIPLLETDGYCQNFESGATSLNINIYGITEGFFNFHGIYGVRIPRGTVAINTGMADHLGVKVGDEIVLRFREADPIPENAPFAPDKGGEGSKVLKISAILGPESAGSFSLGISQIIPYNLFINLQDINPEQDSVLRVNRLLVSGNSDLSEASFHDILKDILLPSDIGLTLRNSDVTGENELVSDRIFIDSSLVENILSRLKNGYPLITYLANSIKTDNTETPYSFVCGLPLKGFSGMSDDDIIISRWLADDLDAEPGSSLILKWFYLTGKKLEEREKRFTVRGIAGNEELYSDPSLMPDFPGISGSTSCSSWDAGIPVLLDRIRDKDEEYWDKHRGTPKAFVSYETGKKLWGNNFGPATAIRFPGDIDKNTIINALKGEIEPADAGFTIKNLKVSGENAATQGVDFGTLFLSLGFFIIISCIILLSFSVSIFFDSKKDMVRTYFSIGFKNALIGKLLFFETSLISVTGALTGIFSGYGVNMLIVHALNSVWTGAVQTDTISAGFSLIPFITGFTATVIIAQSIIMLRLRLYLKGLTTKSDKGLKTHSAGFNKLIVIAVSVLALFLTGITIAAKDTSMILSFSAGVLLFIAFILVIRYYYISRRTGPDDITKGLYRLSKRFYSFNPSQAVTPVIFLAAGIFAIIITTANRTVLTEDMLLNKGGTGGYLLWAESAIPVKEDLNSKKGRDEFGLNEPGLAGLEILQCLRQSGDDASCLNLNHVKSPSLLGLDPGVIATRGSFSFASDIGAAGKKNPWMLLDEKAGEDIIYGIADQTVLQWGLKISTGDTLIFRSENGRPLKIVICGGLKSSLFQGHLLIGENNFRNFYPSVAGSSVFLIDGNQENAGQLISLLSDRFSNRGLSVETAADKLASFFVVTNTYLNVFTVLGIFGLILGVAGLGFMLIRNYDRRSREFALMMATGYRSSRIRSYILTDQVIILIWGIITGTISAFVATLPSLSGSGGISFNLVLIMLVSVFLTGVGILFFSLARVKRINLLLRLKMD